MATLNTSVSHVRAALEPAREGERAQVVLTRPPGYVLAVDEEDVDAARFERLVATGREALGAGDASVARALLTEVLSLWRGAALADFAYEPWAQAEAARLEELRLSAIEDRVEADLALGRHHGLTGELGHLVAEIASVNDCGQPMVALYRSGRQSDAGVAQSLTSLAYPSLFLASELHERALIIRRELVTATAKRGRSATWALPLWRPASSTAPRRC